MASARWRGSGFSTARKATEGAAGHRLMPPAASARLVRSVSTPGKWMIRFAWNHISRALNRGARPSSAHGVRGDGVMSVAVVT